MQIFLILRSVLFQFCIEKRKYRMVNSGYLWEVASFFSSTTPLGVVVGRGKIRGKNRQDLLSA